MSQSDTDFLHEVADSEYKYGFVTEIEADTAPKGLSEDVVRLISSKKEEPQWMPVSYTHLTLPTNREV